MGCSPYIPDRGGKEKPARGNRRRERGPFSGIHAPPFSHVVRSWTFESRLIKYAKRGYAIAVPGLDWDSVSSKLGGRQADEPAEEEHMYYNDDMYAYFEASGLKKLLIANKNSNRFGDPQKRTKFVPHSGTTHDVAMLIKESGEDYGPTLPDVPGEHRPAKIASIAVLWNTEPNPPVRVGSGKYAIKAKVKPFLTQQQSASYVTFEHGGIPTGVAQVGTQWRVYELVRWNHTLHVAHTLHRPNFLVVLTAYYYYFHLPGGRVT